MNPFISNYSFGSTNGTPLHERNQSNRENIENSQINKNLFDESCGNSLSCESISNGNILLLKNEITNFENSLYLHSLPSFTDLINLLLSSNNHPMIKTLMERVNKLVNIKIEENEKRLELINRVQRLENERTNFEKEVGKLRTQINEITDKSNRMESQFEMKRKQLEDDIKKSKMEIIEDQRHIQKLNTKILHLESDLNKAKKNFDNQNEHIIKLQTGTTKGGSNSIISKEGLKFSSSGKADITMSYTFFENNYNQKYNSNISSNINYSSLSQSQLPPQQNFHPKIEFHREIQKNIDEKYKNIVSDNEKLKGFLLDLHLRFVKLVNYKKEVFLDYYKKTFGSEFENENKLELDADLNGYSHAMKNFGNGTGSSTLPILKNLEIHIEIDTFIKTFNNNYIRLEEYLTKNEELSYINNDFERGSSTNSNINNTISSNKNLDRNLFLNEKFLNNMMNLFEIYKEVNLGLSKILSLNTQLKELRSGSLINDFISRLANWEESGPSPNNSISKEITYFSNIKELLNENSVLIQSFSDKININDQTGNIQVNSDVISKYNQDLNKLKDCERNGIESYMKFNNDLYEEISGYEKILNGTLDYCNKN